MKTETLADRLVFPEGPRWREGKLWFSDMNAQRVMTIDLSGNLKSVAEVPAGPSGLGWLPDGRLLIVSMQDRRLLRLDTDGLKTVANLWDLATYHCNDMVVDRLGRAYIGNFGFDLSIPEIVKPAEIIMVTPEGKALVVADKLLFPNGTVITPDGKTFIVAESWGARLTAFDIEENGSLINRRVWAPLEGKVPDGICLDEEGAVWIACPRSSAVFRVHEGGKISRRIQMNAQTYACMLGGPTGRTLFILTSEPPEPFADGKSPGGRIEIIEVEVPHAGWP